MVPTSKFGWRSKALCTALRMYSVDSLPYVVQHTKTPRARPYNQEEVSPRCNARKKRHQCLPKHNQRFSLSFFFSFGGPVTFVRCHTPYVPQSKLKVHLAW